MKQLLARVSIRTALVVATGCTLVGCSGQKFSSTTNEGAKTDLAGQSDEAGGHVKQPNDPQDGAGANGQGGSTETSSGGGASGNEAAAMIKPKVSFIGPPCARGSNCLVEFALDKAYAAPVTFDWLTNDTLYLSSEPPPSGVYAQPGVHYVSTQGQVVFAPGETQRRVFVQNINPYNIEIVIGVRMRNCAYGAFPGNCAEYFR